MEQSRERQVQSITKAVRLLETLARQKTPMSLSELSAQLGWAKSTTHGILSTLAANAVVEQSQQDGRYTLGIKLFELGCAVSGSWDITAVARPRIQQLSGETEECAFLATLNGTDTVLLDTVEAIGKFKIASALGSRAPLYCTSQGKVLLAYQSDYDYRRLVKQLHFHKYTPHTTAGPEALSLACDRLRKEGFCVEKGEYRMGLCSISAPIFDYLGTVRYAVGVTGMFSNIHSPSFERVIRCVRETADDISYEMGYRPQRR
jgi:DNA-binding IclR family transcriptional regulator